VGHYNPALADAAELSGLGMDEGWVNLPPADPEYSGLVMAMRQRLDELGLTDTDGRLIALQAAEDALRAPEQAAQDWLDEVGWPETDDDGWGWEEWDDFKRGAI